MTEYDDGEVLMRRSRRLLDDVAGMLRSLGIDAAGEGGALPQEATEVDPQMRFHLLVAVQELEEIAIAMELVRSAIVEHVLRLDRNRDAHGAYQRADHSLQQYRRMNRH